MNAEQKMESRLLSVVVLIAVVALAQMATAQEAPATPEEVEQPEEPGEAEQEDSPESQSTPLPLPESRPPDYGYGEHTVAASEHFVDEAQGGARVDRRGELDAMAHRTIAMPTAFTPEQFTVSYTNLSLYGNALSFSPTDSLQLTGTMVIPNLDIDFLAGLAGKIELVDDYAYSIALQPFAYYHAGNDELDVKDAGAGLALLTDINVSDNLVVTAGAHAYTTFWYSYDFFEYREGCTRREFLQGQCTETGSESEVFPLGGHWLMFQAAATYYMLDSLSLRGEIFTGPAVGTILGTEWMTEGVQEVAQKRERFEEGTVGVGAPFSTKVTLGMGLAWSMENVGVQFSGYIYRVPGDPVDYPGHIEGWLLTPMLNGSVAF